MKLHHRFTSLLLAAILFLSACGTTVPTAASTPQTDFTPVATGDSQLTPI